MTNFLRNPEIRIHLLLLILGCGVFIAGGFFLGSKPGILISVGCIFFFLFYLVTTYMRYQKIRKLSVQLDDMLHFQTPIPFDQYKEGELSILESELSKMTSHLVEQAERLEKDKVYLSDAMADISHQLRSPLTSSQLIVSLLKDPNTENARRKELLMELSQLLSRINWLIESMLKMAKMDAGTAYLKSETIPVEQLLAKALEPLLIPMELRGINLIQSYEKAEITCDLSWTTEAVLNILKNCMEHTPEGGEIHITTVPTAFYTQITIEDTGCGFDKEDLPHLFERFYKGKDASSQSVGIGLALSRMILSAQNATVKAENRLEGVFQDAISKTGTTGDAQDTNSKTGGARFVIRFYREQAV